MPFRCAFVINSRILYSLYAELISFLDNGPVEILRNHDLIILFLNYISVPMHVITHLYTWHNCVHDTFLQLGQTFIYFLSI